jgi:prefoldin beta subunit
MLNKDTSKKIEDLQAIETQVQNFSEQKQAVEIELNEIKNALEEVNKSSDEVYRVISGLMIKASKSSVIKDLEERKKTIEIKVNALKKQQKVLEKASKKLRDELNKEHRD